MSIKINLFMKKHREEKMVFILNQLSYFKIENKAKILIFNGRHGIPKKFRHEVRHGFNENFVCFIKGFNSENCRVVLGSYRFNLMKPIPLINPEKRYKFLYEKFKCKKNI